MCSSRRRTCCYKYNPEYTCLLVGSKYLLDAGGYDALGGNGRSIVLDAGLALETTHITIRRTCLSSAPRADQAANPAAARCRSWTTTGRCASSSPTPASEPGVDWRPNPGIGFPGYVNYLPVTRAVPEPPSIRNLFGGPAPGPIPYPGAPAYGADLYAPDGTPLWPGLPPAPPPMAPRDPGRDPGLRTLRGSGARADAADAVAARATSGGGCPVTLTVRTSRSGQ